MTGDVVVLALASAINPTMLAVILVLLSLPQRRELIWGYLLGGFALSALVGMLAVHGAANSKLLDEHPHISPAIDVIAGGVLLVLMGLLALRWHRHPPKPEEERKQRESRTERVLKRGTLSIALLVGAITNLPGLYYLIALKDIAADHLHFRGQLAYVLLFNLVMFLPAIVPLVMLRLRPDTTAERLERFDHAITRLIHRYGRTATLIVGVAVAIYLVVSGIIRLD